MFWELILRLQKLLGKTGRGGGVTFCSLSTVFRAILKPVYQFWIPKSDPKTLKSVKINSSKNNEMNVHACLMNVSQSALSVLSYSECKIAKTSRDFAPGPH